MNILVLPVSGGGFVSQLAILEHLCEIGYVPNLTLASSGGNVSAYIAAAANWKWSKIECIARQLSQSLFSRPWNSVMSFSLVIGYFKGDAYNKGNGVKDFLERYFTPKTITKYEIWTGTYNRKRQKARLFSNRSKEESILDVNHIDHDLTQSMESVFTNGDINLIAEESIASASIPAVVPPQQIMDEDYVDGGVAGASPLTIMQEPILRYVREKSKSLHITYVNSIDLSSSDTMTSRNVFDTWRQATKDIIRSQTVIDRLAAYNLLRCYPGTMNKEEFTCNYDNLLRIKLIQARVRYSLLEIYPIIRHEVELVKFNGEDVMKGIRSAYNNCGCRFWWIDDGECLSDDVCSLITKCKESSD